MPARKRVAAASSTSEHVSAVASCRAPARRPRVARSPSSSSRQKGMVRVSTRGVARARSPSMVGTAGDEARSMVILETRMCSFYVLIYMPSRSTRLRPPVPSELRTGLFKRCSLTKLKWPLFFATICGNTTQRWTIHAQGWSPETPAFDASFLPNGGPLSSRG